MGLRSIILAGAAALCVGGSAAAETLTLTFNGVSPKVKIKYKLGGASYKNTNAGRFNWTTTGGDTVHTFCTQLQEFVSQGNTVTYDVKPLAEVPDAPPSPMGVIRAGVMQDLYARFYSTAVFGNAVQAGAFQMLVWETSHELLDGATTESQYYAKLGMTDGHLRFKERGSNPNSQQAIDLATDWLGELGGTGHDTWLGFASLQGLSHPSKQDQLIVVPLPAPLAIAGLGMLGVALCSRQTHRRAGHGDSALRPRRSSKKPLRY